jgi:hypothetical protein
MKKPIAGELTAVSYRRPFRIAIATVAIVCAANLSEAVAEENDSIFRPAVPQPGPLPIP